ncbi:asparaginase domain-containing protein [Reinekea sp.]|jgi:L-asparaginase|uniref:asparaginase domain-containing protein n=1 Tax=Reinekea sp. TaxID=1970455 RepID=UPI003988E2B3
MAHFLIINTGGTIGMVEGPRGLAPCSGVIEQTMSNAADLQNWRKHQLSWIQWQPLLDSSDLSPQHWLDIKASIEATANVDGVLVIHGTDTLSYSAAALSYLLADTAIPIVITGSMLPIGAVQTDAISNLQLALTGLEAKRPEVMVAVGTSLLPGAKTTKATTFKHQAFIASQWQESDWQKPLSRPLPSPNPFADIHQWRPTAIGVFTLFPGCPLDGLMTMVDRFYRAIIINAFGNGNAHDSDAFRRILNRAAEKKIPVFIRSQCLEGHVSFGKYAAGAMFQDCGAVECGHMSFEAVITKLQLLGSTITNSDQLVTLFKHPFSREWQ